MQLFRQLDDGRTDRQTDGQTLLVPKVAIATEKDTKDYIILQKAF